MIIFWLVMILYIFVCFFLVFLVLIQSDKGGGLAGSIGGGLAGASNLIGTQDTANILTKLTTGFAIGFMALSIVLSLLLSHLVIGKGEEKSMLKEHAAKHSNTFSPTTGLQQLPAGGIVDQQGPQGAPGQQAAPVGTPAPATAGNQEAPAPQQQQQAAPAAQQTPAAAPAQLPVLPASGDAKK